jgi:hypothetical protein
VPLHFCPHHLAGPQRRARVLHGWHLLRLLLLWRPELLVRLRCCCCCLLLVHQLELVRARELVVVLLVHHLRKGHLGVASISRQRKQPGCISTKVNQQQRMHMNAEQQLAVDQIVQVTLPKAAGCRPNSG